MKLNPSQKSGIKASGVFIFCIIWNYFFFNTHNSYDIEGIISVVIGIASFFISKYYFRSDQDKFRKTKTFFLSLIGLLTAYAIAIIYIMLEIFGITNISSLIGLGILLGIIVIITFWVLLLPKLSKKLNFISLIVPLISIWYFSQFSLKILNSKTSLLPVIYFIPLFIIFFIGIYCIISESI